MLQDKMLQDHNLYNFEIINKIIKEPYAFWRSVSSGDPYDYRWLAALGSNRPVGSTRTTPPTTPSFDYAILRTRAGRSLPSQRDLFLSPAELFARNMLWVYEKKLIETEVPTNKGAVTVNWDDESNSKATFHESKKAKQSGEDIGIQYPFAKFFVMKAAQHITSSIIDGFKTRFSPLSLSFWMNNPVRNPYEFRRQQLFNSSPEELKALRDSNAMSQEDMDKYIAKNSEFRVFSSGSHPKDWGDYFWEQTEYRYSFIYQIMKKVDDEYKILWQKYSKSPNRKKDEDIFKEAQEIVHKDFEQRFKINPALPGYIEAVPFQFPTKGTGKEKIDVHQEAMKNEGHVFFHPGEKISHPWFWQAFGKTKDSFNPQNPFSYTINDINIHDRKRSDNAYWLNPLFWVSGNNWAQDNLKGISEWVKKLKALVKGKQLTYWQEKQKFPKDQILERNLQDPWDTKENNEDYDHILHILSSEDSGTKDVISFLNTESTPIISFSVQNSGGQTTNQSRAVYLPDTIKRLALLIFRNPAFRGNLGLKTGLKTRTLEASGNPYDNVNFSSTKSPDSGEAPFDFVPVVGDLTGPGNFAQTFANNQSLEAMVQHYAQQIAPLDRMAQEEKLAQPNRGDSGTDVHALRASLSGHVNWSKKYSEAIDEIMKKFPDTYTKEDVIKRLHEAVHKEHMNLDKTLGQIKIPRVDYLDKSILHSIREHLSGPNFLTFLDTFGGDFTKMASHIKDKINKGEYDIEFSDKPHAKIKTGGLVIGPTVATSHPEHSDQSRTQHEIDNGLFRDFGENGMPKNLRSGMTRIVPLDTGGQIKIPIGITEKLHNFDKAKIQSSLMSDGKPKHC